MTTPDLLGSRLPLVGAPMAGGATTVDLALAVASAGGFPFLAAGYTTPEAIAEEVAQLANRGIGFGVNLFVPGADSVDAAAFTRYARELQPEADAFGITLNNAPQNDDDHWQEKLALLRERPVPVVSFTFGLPTASDVESLRRVGSVTLATITTADEALAARDVGVDGLVVQGWAAGGHSATFDPHRRPDPMTTAELVRTIRRTVDLPLIAGGGVDGSQGVAELIAAGAAAVAVGTLLLRTDESGASPTHQEALVDEQFGETVLTHAFSGRPARGLRNGFIDRHDATAPLGYPAIHHLTSAMRRAAAQQGDASRLNLWAGTGFRAAARGPAAAVIADLASAL